MSAFEHITKLQSPDLRFVTGVTDLQIGWFAGLPVLYSATRLSQGGLATFAIDPAGATGFVSALGFSGVTTLAPTTIAIVENWHTPTGLGAAFTGGFQQSNAGIYRLLADGSIDRRANLAANGPDLDLVAVTTLALDGQSMIFGLRAGSLAPTAYLATGDGTMTKLAVATDLSPATMGTLDQITTIAHNGQVHLLAAASTTHEIVSYIAPAGGVPVRVDLLSMSSGPGIAHPGALALVAGYGTLFGLVGGAGSNSLSVLALDDAGLVSVLDHVLDTTFTRFETIRVIEAFNVADRIFVVAGGGDDGLTLMLLLPDGRL